MKWSWRLGKFGGINVYIHFTFLLLIGFLVVSYWLQERSVASVLSGVGFILSIFACVLLHEFGHALAARKYGVQTRDITLYPIGGVARLERIPEKPREELWVALAGPAVNVVIAGILFFVLTITNSMQPVSALSMTQGSFLERLMIVNISLVLFNLIPAFPLDGGRVLRALFAFRLEYTRATQIAATLGQGLAVILGFVGLFSNPFLLFIAFFIWIAAAQEASMVQMKSSIAGIPVNRVMYRQFRSLTPGQPLADAIDLILQGAQQDFPVVEAGRVVGVLTRSTLFAALSRQGAQATVAQVMQRDFQTVDSHEMLDSALLRMQSCNCQSLPILHAGQLVGILTMENVGEFLAIQAALKPAQTRQILDLNQ